MWQTIQSNSEYWQQALVGIILPCGVYFFQGLNKYLKDELVVRNETLTLDALISLAVQLDNRFSERKRERNRQFTSSQTFTPPVTRHVFPKPVDSPASRQPVLPLSKAPDTSEPTQLGRAHLTPEERSRRLTARECLYCGQKGHFINSYPLRPGTPKAKAHQL